MLDTFIKLLIFQVLGEASVFLLSIPIPGAVAGMLLLLVFMVIRGGREEKLAHSSERLLRHMTLLFIPSAVGITLHLDRLRAEWLPILAALVASTLVTVIVTAVVANWFRHDK